MLKNIINSLKRNSNMKKSIIFCFTVGMFIFASCTKRNTCVCDVYWANDPIHGTTQTYFGEYSPMSCNELEEAKNTADTLGNHWSCHIEP